MKMARDVLASEDTQIKSTVEISDQLLADAVAVLCCRSEICYAATAFAQLACGSSKNEAASYLPNRPSKPSLSRFRRFDVSIMKSPQRRVSTTGPASDRSSPIVPNVSHNPEGLIAIVSARTAIKAKRYRAPFSDTTIQHIS